MLTNSNRDRFVASWVYDLPGVGKESSLVNHVLGGWQLSGVYQYQSGGWLTINSGTDISRDGLGGDLAVRIDGVSLAPPAGSPQTIWFNKDAFRQGDVGTFGTNTRNIMKGPANRTLDMGLFKNVRFSNSKGMQFRAEFFNLLNTVNFAGPNTSVNSGNFGRITGTHSFNGDPRIVQFGLKFVF